MRTKSNRKILAPVALLLAAAAFLPGQAQPDFRGDIVNGQQRPAIAVADMRGTGDAQSDRCPQLLLDRRRGSTGRSERY